MNAGRLKERISIWRNQGEKNDYGEKVGGWNMVSSVRAEATQQNARKAMASGEVIYPYMVIFLVRAYTDVKEGDRVLWKDKWYDVISCTERDIDRSITISATLHND